MNVTEPKLFIKEAGGVNKNYGVQQSYANINDIANLRQMGPNKWEADSKGKIEGLHGKTTVYHFDDEGANKILNYMA